MSHRGLEIRRLPPPPPPSDPDNFYPVPERLPAWRDPWTVGPILAALIVAAVAIVGTLLDLEKETPDGMHGPETPAPAAAPIDRE